MNLLLSEIQNNKAKKSLKPTETTVKTISNFFVEDTTVDEKLCGGIVVVVNQLSSPICFPSDLEGRLFISSQDGAANWHGIMKSNITHILNVGYGIENHFESSHIEYKTIEILDVPESEFPFEDCLSFLNNVLQSSRNSKILVHCNAGVSRSATVIIAWIMSIARKQDGSKLSYEEALDILRKYRPSACPNTGFKRQLVQKFS